MANPYNKLLLICLLALAALCFLLLPGTSSLFPAWRELVQQSVSMNLSGQSSLQVSADRALVAIRVHFEGSKQSKVSDEVKSTANEVLTLLRPLTELHNSTNEDFNHPPVVDLSVNTFQSTSWQKDTLLGQSPVFKGQTEISAEFSDLESLGIVLAKISKLSHLSVESVLWKLSDDLKADVFFRCREAAMNDLLAKFRAYVKPLGLANIRAIRIDEESRQRPSRMWEKRRGRREESVMHDELQLMDVASYWRPEDRSEAYAMESRSLEVTAMVSGDFEAY